MCYVPIKKYCVYVILYYPLRSYTPWNLLKRFYNSIDGNQFYSYCLQIDFKHTRCLDVCKLQSRISKHGVYYAELLYSGRMYSGRMFSIRKNTGLAKYNLIDRYKTAEVGTVKSASQSRDRKNKHRHHIRNTRLAIFWYDRQPPQTWTC